MLYISKYSKLILNVVNLFNTNHFYIHKFFNKYNRKCEPPPYINMVVCSPHNETKKRELL